MQRSILWITLGSLFVLCSLTACSNFQTELPTQTIGNTIEERLQSVTWRAVSMDGFDKLDSGDPIRYVENYSFTDTTMRYDQGNIHFINKDGSPRLASYDSIVSFTPTRLEVLRKLTRERSILFYGAPMSSISHPLRIVFVAEPKGYNIP